MSWLDGLSAALTAGSQGAAGWMQGQDRARKEAEERAKEAAAALRQKHLDEQNALMQQMTMSRWKAEDERTGNLDRMGAEEKGWQKVDDTMRMTDAMKAAPSAVDAEFGRIGNVRRQNAITLGGKGYVAPLENATQRVMRERNEDILTKAQEARERAEMEGKKFGLDRDRLSEEVRSNKAQEDIARSRVSASGSISGGGGAGGRTTDAQKRAQAMLHMANAAVEALDGTPQTLQGALDKKLGGKSTSLGMYTQPYLRQQAGKIAGIFSADPFIDSENAQLQAQSARQLSDAWLRYTSGAAVPEPEVQRFAAAFIPRAGESEALRRRKQQMRAEIINAMKMGVGQAPLGQINRDPYRLSWQKKWIVPTKLDPENVPMGVEPSAAPTNMPDGDYRTPYTSY